jgi:probable O-glycosylation ligase (exosortase A-associated)
MLRSLFVLGILALGLVCSVVSRFAALLTYVWFALFRPQEFLWMDVSSWRLSLVIGLLLLIPSLLTGVLPNLTHPLSIGTLAFLGTALIAQTVTMWPDVSWPWIDMFARLAFVTLFAVTILNSRRRVVLFLAVLAGSLGFHTAKAGLAATLSGGVRFAEGLGGAFSDNNGYAMAGAMILPLLWCVAQNLDKTRKIERIAAWGFLAAVPLSIFMVIGTMSRAGFLAIATAVLIYISLQRSRLVPLVTVTLVVLLALPFVPTPEGYFDRLNTIRTYDEEQESSALSRLHFWQVAVRMVAAHPLGVGMRNYEKAYDNFDFSGGQYGSGRSVHSSHFQVLSELGYAGAFVWVSLFVCAFVVANRTRAFGKRPDLPPDEARFYLTTANALMVSMAAFLVGGAFIALALNDITWYTFAAVAATHRLVNARKRELDAGRPLSVPVRDIPEINLPRRATA